MKKFWNWSQDNETKQRELWIEGAIAEESWFDDDVTPAIFKEELNAGTGPVKLHISSPGGDVFAASKIYTMLMEYPADVYVQIDSLAASAASVIAMAGTHVAMSPTSLMMIHNPFTVAYGDSAEMVKTIHMLDEVKDSIINAYQIKTGLNRATLSQLMDEETWMNSYKAKELGFIDEVLYDEDNPESDAQSGFAFAQKSTAARIMNRVMASIPKPEPTPAEPNRVSATEAENRLMRAKYI